MRTRTGLIAVVAVVGAGAGVAAADLTYTSQAREIYVRAGTNEDGVAAAGFGAFSETRSVEYAPGFVEETSATQFSVLLPDRVVGVGVITVDDGIQGWAGTARSVLDASFTVEEPTVYTLTGSWLAHVSIHTTPSVFVRLSDPSGVLFISEIEPEHELGWSDTFDVTGTLAPGVEYRFEAVVSWNHYSLAGDLSERTANFEVVLAVPAPGVGVILAAAGVLGVRRRR